jgi:hypothetical protein
MTDTIPVNTKTLLKILTILLAVIFFISGFPGFITVSSALADRPFPKKESEVPRISPQELKNHFDKGEAVMIVDVRPISAFNAQHIVGAASVPLDEVELRLDELPPEKKIVFY